MLKKIVINIVIGGLIGIIGLILYKSGGEFGRLGEAMAAGLWWMYIIGSIIIILIMEYATSAKELANQTVNGIEKKKAEEELLRSKELLDKGILTQDEFDTKVKKLKHKIL